MRAVASLLLIAILADAPITVPAQIRLKNGTVYRLKEPPFRKDGRMIFTTTDGKVYSLDESEVSEVRLLVPTPTTKPRPNPQDSRDLGAIARQQNQKAGKHTLVAPAPTPRPTPEPAP